MLQLHFLLLEIQAQSCLPQVTNLSLCIHVTDMTGR